MAPQVLGTTVNALASIPKEHPAKSSSIHDLSGDTLMNSYATAIEAFRTSAVQFIQNLQYLVRARNAYQEAITTSAELRTALDTTDYDMRMLLTQIERALNP